MKPAPPADPGRGDADRGPAPDSHPLLPFDWSNRRLWALEIAVEEVPVAELAWHLDQPLWSTVAGHRRFDLCPSTVLATPEDYPEHSERIDRADLSYPLDLVPAGGRYVVADGVHRLAKACRLGRRTIAVRRMPDARRAEIETSEETDD